MGIKLQCMHMNILLQQTFGMANLLVASWVAAEAKAEVRGSDFYSMDRRTDEG